MKKIYLIIYILTNVLLSPGQTCNSTFPPNYLFYPNTVNTPTTASFNDVEYLCGPNTIVYDTISNVCYTYVNANCTLTIKPNCSFCPALINVWLKNNSVLNILPGNCTLLNVYKEPLATVNNPFNFSATINSCSAITFPTVNCTATGIKENNLNNAFEIYPNPANDILNFSFNLLQTELFSKIRILNNLNQVVMEEDLKNNSINIKDLPNGVYFINLSNSRLGSINRRFVIER